MPTRKPMGVRIDELTAALRGLQDAYERWTVEQINDADLINAVDQALRRAHLPQHRMALSTAAPASKPGPAGEVTP